MWLSPLHEKKTLNIYGHRKKDAFSFRPRGIVPCVPFTGEEKLNLTFLSDILLSSRNGTSSLLEVHSLDSYITHIFPLSLFALYLWPLLFFLFIPSMAESTTKIEIINSVRKSTSKQQFEPNGSTFLRWQWFWISVGLFLCFHSLVSAIEHKPKPGDLWDCRKALGYAFKYEFGLWFWNCPL